MNLAGGTDFLQQTAGGNLTVDRYSNRWPEVATLNNLCTEARELPLQVRDYFAYIMAAGLDSLAPGGKPPQQGRYNDGSHGKGFGRVAAFVPAAFRT